MKVEKIDHIHVYVKDLEKAKNLFSSILGTRFSEIIDLPEFDLRSVIEPLGIELIEPRSQDSFVEKLIERRGQGLGAVSLKVTDIDKAIEEMKSLGLRLIGQASFGGLKEAWFHPEDAFGVMIELCEYEARHPGELAMREG